MVQKMLLFLATPTAGTITEDSDSSTTTSSGLSGTLSASDADGDTLTYGIANGTVASGTSTLAGTYGSLAVNTTSGAYNYTPTSAAVEALCAGEVTDSVTVSVTDGIETTSPPLTRSTSQVPMTPASSLAISLELVQKTLLPSQAHYLPPMLKA